MTVFDLRLDSPFDTTLASGVLKQGAADFKVEELLSPECAEAGEHVWLWLEKTGQNSEFVARQLARAYGVRDMDVGFSGLKDRHAVTRQWFSIYLGKRPEPDWQSLVIEGVCVLARHRHLRKLRRGEHRANRFSIVLREFTAEDGFFKILEQIRAQGFPNYFGDQRFGHAGQNLQRAEAWFEGRIKVSRSQRAMYLSAVRAWLFNLNLRREVAAGHWLQAGEGPLYGDDAPGVLGLSETERGVLVEHPLFAKGIHQNRMSLMRRPYVVVPEAMSWRHEGDMLQLEFTLPAGAFATTLLALCMQVNDASLRPQQQPSAGAEL